PPALPHPFALSLHDALPISAATQQPSGNAGKTSGGNNQKVMPTVPFVRASAQHREPTGIDVSKTLTTSDQDLGVHDIPAYGYVRDRKSTRLKSSHVKISYVV